MTAFNVVRFRVKPGEEQRFVEYHRKARPAFKGFLGGSLVKTGEQAYCFVAEWRTFQSIVKARPQMIALLDGIRDALEDLGGELGVTDAVSGTSVVKLRAPVAAKPAMKKKKKAPAARRKKAGRKRS